jgi:TetR/AcrR family transcriptional regulator of autoinduction and epiphytic fitness
MHAVKRMDGRHARTVRTNAAIVTALVELLDEGRIEPTAAEIAERAGVATRSISQHFGSREDLLLAVAEHHAERFAASSVDATGSLADRLGRFVSARAALLEATRAMRNAGAVVAWRSPAVKRALSSAERHRRDETSAVFAREIAASDEPKATERALAVVTSGRAWDAMRVDLALTRANATALLERMVRVAVARRSTYAPSR